MKIQLIFVECSESSAQRELNIINSNIEKEERSQIDNLGIHLRKLEKNKRAN